MNTDVTGVTGATGRSDASYARNANPQEQGATGRAAFKANRDAGLVKRQQTRIAGRTQCHYCNDASTRCTAEVADPLAEVALCTKHLARVVEYVTHLQARIIKGATS